MFDDKKMGAHMNQKLRRRDKAKDPWQLAQFELNMVMVHVVLGKAWAILSSHDPLTSYTISFIDWGEEVFK